jgi:uncharacterized protein with ACT and thioredoxin-like domain
MKNSLFLVILCLSLLVGCNTNSDVEKETELKPLNVEISVSPEKLNPSEEVKIDAQVTYGDEKVEDADEVKFQIWEKGNEEEDEFINGEHKGKGIYSITKEFDHDGVFIVVAHVTARSMHNMPKKEILVGDATQLEESNEEAISETDEHNNHSHEGHDTATDHHHSEIVIDLLTDEAIKSNQATTLATTIKNGESELTEANVRFEIWKDGEENHVYIDAEESKSGHYEQVYKFLESGAYIVKVHVEKDEIHDHIEQTLTVTE